MSDYDDDNEDSKGIKSLREAHDRAQEELKAKTAKLAELETKFRTRELADEIGKRGLDPRVAALIPQNAENVTEWLDTYGDLFGGKKAAPDTTDEPGANGVTADEEAELRKQQEAEQGKRPNNEGDLVQKIDSAQSFEEIASLVRAAQRRK